MIILMIAIVTVVFYSDNGYTDDGAMMVYNDGSDKVYYKKLQITAYKKKSFNHSLN